MKNTIIFTSILLLVLAFTACTKDKNNIDDNVSKPSVHVHKPVDGAMYNAGDTIPVKVHFMDDDELHEYHIHVMNKTMMMDLLHLHGHTHSTSHEVDTFVIASASVHSDYELITKVSNHNGEEAMDTIRFHVHP
jgi:hypothetical protein